MTEMTASNISNIHYHLDFKQFNQHLVEVVLSFRAATDAPKLWLPAWIPGSYLMREFARNITTVHYRKVVQTTSDTSNKSDASSSLDALPSQVARQAIDRQRAVKLSKNEWQLPSINACESVKVHYEVYCYDLSVRTAYVDQTRLYGNFTSLALAVAGQEKEATAVTLSVPQRFVSAQTQQQPIKLACGLAHTYLHSDNQHYYHVQADSYDDLIDYPFEIAPQDEFNFIVHDDRHKAIAHRFYIAGKHSANLGRLQQDVTRICQSYLNWLGDAPFSLNGAGAYTFLTYATGNDYGGLEHINSTSLVIPRSDLPMLNEAEEPSEAYQRFLGLCSHEYFHAWWVKTVRPDVMMDVDLQVEAYTPLLWVFEGFTSYIDDFMLQASGVISKESYLKLLGSQLNRYTQTHGRHLQSVAESSFDAWIKLYRADENTSNAGISYYNKGALVALCLDLTLLAHSEGNYRIFDVVQAFYDKAKAQNNQRIGMTALHLDAVIGEFMSLADWQDFKTRYVDGVEELPLQDLLAANGVGVGIDNKDNTLPWGMSVSDSGEGLKVIKVLRDSVASEAGISAKDVIVAIDGIKASSKNLQSVAESNLASILCHAFRRDELMTFTVAHKTASGIDANPSLDNVSLSLKETGFETWLKPDFVE